MFLSIKTLKPRFFLSFAIVMASMSMASCAVAPATDTTHVSSINNTHHTYSLNQATPVRANSDAQASNNTQILQLIRDKFVSPTGSYRETVATVLTVTVNSQGYVTNVSADSNNAHAQAAVNAIRAVGRFPIDSSDSKYPKFKIAFRGQN